MTEQARLAWRSVPGGIAFHVVSHTGEESPETWGRFDVVTEGGRPANVGPLLGLVEDESATTGGVQVMVPNDRVAALDEVQLGQLGLPSAAPLRLKISGAGILASPSFRFNYQFIKSDGGPVMGLRRDGALLFFGGKSYTLLDPLFQLVEGMDAFNATPPTQMDDRMHRWAQLKPLLPEDAVVDNALRSMNVVRADAFSLDLDASGQISPVLLHRAAADPADLTAASTSGEPALPPAPQQAFSQRFKQQSHAQRHYTAPGNWFVVVPPLLQQALQVVREYQSRPAIEQRAFAANPTAALKERLEGELDSDELDQLFEETPEFLSSRVTHLGHWEPKANAYIMPSNQRWFPDDDGQALGIVVAGSLYTVSSAEVTELAGKIDEARQAGKATLEYRGQQIPATDEAIGNLERLKSALQPRQLPEPSDDVVTEVDGRNDTPPVVPVLIDNLEELGFTAAPRPFRGEPGGIPAALKTATLYRHQLEGLQWLQEHWAKGSTGALLADDMGLGKTLQTLAFLAWVQEQMESGHHQRRPLLIVAPTGLLKNWEDEVDLHLTAPGLGRLFKAFGPDLRELRGMTQAQSTARIESAEWVLTTYETLRDKINYFLRVKWAVVAFDEAQKIKNPASRVTEMAKSIDADFFLTLTGTPVENRMADLWSIVDLIAPGELGAMRDFHERYEATSDDVVNKALNELRIQLTEDPTPVRLLRRMKADHLQGLPAKHEHVVKMEMPPAQVAAYDTATAPARSGEKIGSAVLNIIQGMRRISLLPAPLSSAGLDDGVVEQSARLSALIQILDRVHAAGEKALVFLEYLAVQDALLSYLQRRYAMPRPPLRISGSVDGSVRKRFVDQFQNAQSDRFDVMLLSPKAGGVGLTLTAANHVVHLSRWWNPAVEDQCTDRAYRIGQKRDVHVYYPMAIHPVLGDESFDVNLHNLLERKRSLSHRLLAPPMASNDDLDALLRRSIVR